MTDYKLTKQSTEPFEETVENVRAALAAEGFGVLTEIDVKATMKKKLGVDYDNYAILGVCNPPLAHKALAAQKDIGLFLPCNVIVYEDDGKVLVSAMLPTAMMNMLDNPTLHAVAEEAEKKLRRIVSVL